MSSHVIELKNAFGDTSDPQHLFQSKTHTQALKDLSEPLQDNRNFRVLVGDPGTGKTVLLLSLLQRSRPSAFTVRLFWTQLQRDEFLHYFLQELGISRPSTDIREAQTQLTRVLEQNFSCGRTVVLVIDEAHKLNLSTLQGLAELLDCPLARSKQLRLILAGLPSLRAKLECAALQEMKNRISGVASLRALSPEESASYIRRRLDLCGFGSQEPFTDDAIAIIAQIADGIPREINNICFELAFWAEQSGRDRIDGRTLLECASVEVRMRTRYTAQPVLWVDGATSAEPPQLPNSALLHIPAKAEMGNIGSPNDNSREDSSPAVVVSRENIEAASKSISDWFGSDRLAWSGTAGELATSLQQRESELIQILSASLDALQSLGIGLTIVEFSGRPKSVSLRALKGRKKARVETPNTESTLSAPENASQHEPESAISVTENHSQVLQLSGDTAEHAPNHALQTDPATTSALDEVLELWDSKKFEPPVESRISRFRWALVPMLLVCLLALIFAFGVRHHRLLRQEDSGTQTAQQLNPTASAVDTVSGERREKVTADKDVDAVPGAEFNPGRNNKLPSEPSSDLLRAARSGDPQAQFQLGTAYVTGDRVSADTVTGYTWLTLAFANGNKQAESRLRQLSRSLNASEIARVRRNLGQMYTEGVGVPPDKVTAYMWHLLAEFSGETRSRIERTRLARSMTPDQKSEAHARASEWLRRHHQPLSRTLPES